jgi:hypothetical protein
MGNNNVVGLSVTVHYNALEFQKRAARALFSPATAAEDPAGENAGMLRTRPTIIRSFFLNANVTSYRFEIVCLSRVEHLLMFTLEILSKFGL